MVQQELVLTFDDLIKRPLIEDYITLCCVSNPVGGPYIGNAKWLGASLRSLLQEAGIKAGARPAAVHLRRTASPPARRCRRRWTAGTRCWPSP